MKRSDLTDGEFAQLMYAIAFAHACEEIEKRSLFDAEYWRYELNKKASRTFYSSTKDEIDQFIDENFVNNEEHFMEIKVVHYSAVVNLGNYQNEKIGFEAQLGQGESVEAVVEALRAKVREIGGIDAEKMYTVRSEARQALYELERKTAKAREEWNRVAEFLRTQYHFTIRTRQTKMEREELNVLVWQESLS
jgi:hypothetical protein